MDRQPDDRLGRIRQQRFLEHWRQILYRGAESYTFSNSYSHANATRDTNTASRAHAEGTSYAGTAPLAVSLRAFLPNNMVKTPCCVRPRQCAFLAFSQRAADSVQALCEHLGVYTHTDAKMIGHFKKAAWNG